MKFVPRPYQAQIIEHIFAHPRCAVWADMGMGKTVSTLTAVCNIMEYLTPGPALVIAPLRVAQTTWPDEVGKWDHLSHLRVSVIAGNKDQRVAAADTPADVYCTNFESIPWLVKHYLDRKQPWPFSIIVVDEATRLKGFRTQQGSMRARVLSTVAYMSKHFIELTGTPAPNGLLDLWGQVWFLDKGKRLGKSMQAFKERWFYPKKVGANAFAIKWLPNVGAIEEVQSRVRDLSLKLRAEDWFEIEKPITVNVNVRLPKEAMQHYREMERELYTELEDEAVEAANAAARTGKCLQIASGAVYTDDKGTKYSVVHDQKIEALKSIVEEAAGKPVLVAYQFRHDADRILKSIKGSRLLDKSVDTIRKWNRGEIPVLVAHPASCGHGLNLQDGGNILCFFSTGWNLEEHEQMVERIGPTRQAQSGHPRPVFVYNIVAEGTLDEAVQIRMVEKREVLDILLERKNRA